ncbi:BnaC02g31370D [Brassica napus]|nr:unnamed protein product [Brassica napus]CDY36716.1 BnaC02g31370D [Brassica napus]
MLTEKDTTGGVKKMESETLPSAKIEGPVDSEMRAASKEKTVDK